VGLLGVPPGGIGLFRLVRGSWGHDGRFFSPGGLFPQIRPSEYRVTTRGLPYYPLL